MYVELPLRVRFAEVDAGGFVYHAHYVPWLELGRHELLRALGVSYAELAARRLHLIVARLDITYRKPTAYDERLRLQIAAAPLGPGKSHFDYRLRRDDQLVLEAASDHGWVNAELRAVSLKRAAPDLFARLERGLAQDDGAGFAGRLLPPATA